MNFGLKTYIYFSNKSWSQLSKVAKGGCVRIILGRFKSLTKVEVRKWNGYCTVYNVHKFVKLFIENNKVLTPVGRLSTR